MPRGPDFIPSLESLRGLAALDVALFHSFYFMPVTGNQSRVAVLTFWDWETLDALAMRIVLSIFTGSAVMFFFVLSGFVLALSLRRSEINMRNGLQFCVGRFRRIYPALTVNLLFSFVAAALTYAMFRQAPTVMQGWIPKYWPEPGVIWPYLPTLRMLLDNALLLRFPLNGATWTLAVEMAATPFILGATWIAMLAGPAGAVVLVAAALVCWLADILIPTVLAPFLFMFWAGIAVAFLPAFHLSNRAALTALLVSALALMFARTTLGFSAPAAQVTEGFASAAIVAIVANTHSCRYQQVLDSPPLRLLGRISYSFYLYHSSVMLLAMPILFTWFLTQPSEFPFVAGMVLAAISVALTVPVAMLSYTYVERPGRRWRLAVR